jgi:hypothetical protein
MELSGYSAKWHAFPGKFWNCFCEEKTVDSVHRLSTNTALGSPWTKVVGAEAQDTGLAGGVCASSS